MQDEGQVAIILGSGSNPQVHGAGPMTRSQMAFILGVLDSVLMLRRPSVVMTSLKSESRSWIRNRSSVPRFPDPSSDCEPAAPPMLRQARGRIGLLEELMLAEL